MNMKKIFKHILLSALTITAVASCKDDRNNFLPDDSFGFNNAKNDNVVTIPIYGGEYDINIIKSGKGFNEGTVNITTSNAELLAYNKEFEADYIPLPKDQNLYSFSSESISFATEDVTKPVKISWDIAKVGDYMAQEPANQYCIPVVLRSDDLEVNDGRQIFILNLKQTTIDVLNETLSKTFILDAAKKESADITIQLDLAITNTDVKVDFVADETLIEKFNADKGTNYVAAPEGSVTFASSVTFEKGSVEKKLAVNFNTESFFVGGEPVEDLAEGYLVPVKISNISLDGLIRDNYITYVILKVEKPRPPQLFDRIWGHYSDAAGKLPWFMNKGLSVDGLVGTYGGADRNYTMDDDFVYIAQSNAVAAIHKFDVKTGAYAGTLSVENVVTADNVTDFDKEAGLTYPLNCVRMFPNTNPEVNGGKDVLVVSNLAETNAYLAIYAYVDGIDEAPVKVYGLKAARRFGDKMSVSGVWGNGYFWLRSNEDGRALVANIPFDGKGVEGVQTWIAAYNIDVNDYAVMGEVYWTPQKDNTIPGYCLIGTNSDKGLHLMSGITGAGTGSELACYPALASTFGWNFFESNGKKYIAFVSVLDKEHPSVQVIEGDYTTEAGLKAALDAYSPKTVVFSAPLQDELDPTVAGYTGSTIGDCYVRNVNGEIYMLAGANQVGLSLFKLNPDF